MPVSKPSPRRKSPILSFVGEGGRLWTALRPSPAAAAELDGKIIYRGATPAQVGHGGRNSKEFARDARVLFSLFKQRDGQASFVDRLPDLDHVESKSIVGKR